MERVMANFGTLMWPSKLRRTLVIYDFRKPESQFQKEKAAQECSPSLSAFSVKALYLLLNICF